MAYDADKHDGAKYPFVQAIGDFEVGHWVDGTWHKRPSDDPWVVSDEGPNAKTLCGRAVASVHVSQYDPRIGDLTKRVKVCKTCLLAVPR